MMSFVGNGNTGTEAAQKFLESLQNDFRNLSAETKKKNPQIKEVIEQNLQLNTKNITLMSSTLSVPYHLHSV